MFENIIPPEARPSPPSAPPTTPQARMAAILAKLPPDHPRPPEMPGQTTALAAQKYLTDLLAWMRESETALAQAMYGISPEDYRKDDPGIDWNNEENRGRLIGALVLSLMSITEVPIRTFLAGFANATMSALMSGMLRPGKEE